MVGSFRLGFRAHFLYLQNINLLFPFTVGSWGFFQSIFIVNAP